MAQRGFKDEIQVSSDNDQTGASRGQIADTSAGTLLETFGTAIGQGIEAADEFQQQNIRNEVEDTVDTLDRQLGVDDLTALDGDPEGTQIPQALLAGGQDLEGIQQAFNQGRITETQYFSRLNAAVKQLRARYPGHRDHIDSIVSDVMGSPAANVLRKTMFKNLADAQNASAKAATREHNEIVDNSHHLSPDRYRQYQENPSAELRKELLLEIASSKRFDIQQSRIKTQFDITRENAEQQGVNLTNSIISQHIEQGLQGKETAFDELDRLIEERGADGELDAQDREDITFAFQQLKLKVKNDVTAQLNETLKDGNSFATFLKDDGVQKMLNLVDQRFAPWEEALFDQKKGRLSFMKRAVEGIQDDARYRLYTGPNGEKLASLTALFKALPPDLATIAFGQEQGGQVIPFVRQLAKVHVFSNMVKGEQTFDELLEESERNDVVLDGQDMKSLLNLMKSAMEHPDTPSDTIENLVDSMFNQGNIRFLENNFQSMEDKQIAFAALTTPAAVTQLQQLGQEAVSKYQNWVSAQMGQFIADDVNELTRSNISDDDSTITYNPSTSTFDVNFDVELPTFFSGFPDPVNSILQGGSVLGSNTIEAIANVNVVRSVNRLNAFLPRMRESLKLSGMSDEAVAQRIQQQLAIMGLDLDPANKKGSLITRFQNAVVNFLTETRQKLERSTFGDNPETEPNAGNLNDDPDFKQPSGASQEPQEHGFTLPLTPSSFTTVQGVEGVLLDAVSGAESRRDGYNAVNRGVILGLTGMTLNEVMRVTRARKGPRGEGGPGDPSTAAGRYQILNATMAGLIKEMGLTGQEIFDEDMQDQMAIQLLRRRGLDKFLAGTLSKESFARGLMNEWTGLKAVPQGLLDLLDEIAQR